MPFIGDRIAFVNPDIVDVHGEDCRVFRVRPAGADLVVRLLVKGLGEGITDVISRVPWSASRALLERYQHGVVPSSRRGPEFSNLLACGIGGTPSRCCLSGNGINYGARISAVGTVDE